MKFIITLLSIGFLFTLQDCANAQSKPEIDYIITNDYMSERNLSFMGGPITSTYKRGLVDSLRNSYVEIFEKGLLKEKKYYNSIGAQYQTNIYFYGAKDRVDKMLEIDEYFNDTITFLHEYQDSASYLVRKSIITIGKKTNRLDFYYQQDSNGVNIVNTLYENGQLYFKDSINEVSKTERRIKSYNNDNQLSTYLYKYNNKELIVYEKTKKLEKIAGEYVEVKEEYEYLFKYDTHGNWTESVKQTICPPKKKSLVKKPITQAPKVLRKVSVEEEVKSESWEDCKPEIKEKLLRKIFYK